MKLTKVNNAKHGDTRVKEKFAWLPTKVFKNGTYDFVWIWFEGYFIQEVYNIDWSGLNAPYTWQTNYRYTKN